MSLTATRDGYGKALKEIAQQDSSVIAMDADLGRSTRSFSITEVDPRRFIEMGIAEQDMISTAVGLSLTGKIVFVNSFSVFLTGRAFDQIRQQVSLPGSNIKLCGSSSGLTIGPDGATHQSVLDLGLMRLLPNMTVIVPADPAQAEKAVWSAYKLRGPAYLRLSRCETGNFLDDNLPFILGQAQPIQKGVDVALVSCGPILKNVITASALLAAHGISSSIYNFHTLKPFDTPAAIALSRSHQLVAAIEEHSIFGGLCTAFAEALAQSNNAAQCNLLKIGIQDTFGESGCPDELLKKHGLDPQSIVDSILPRINL